MAEIKVNLENLKDNEREQLLALIEKANKKPKWLKPKDGDSYWYVSGHGLIQESEWENDLYDEWRYDLNNCFETKEEAEFEVEKRKVVAELEIFARDNSDEIDWGNGFQKKYFLYYYYEKGTLEIDYAFYCQTQGGIYFSSEELCKQATEKVGKDRIKKYLFEVEE